MVLNLMPQVFAEAGPGVVTGQPGQERADEAVVLAGPEIDLLIVNTHQIPPIEQVAQLIMQAGKPVPPSSFECHPDIVARVDGLALPGSPAGAQAAARELVAA
jgi:hypothetical protein